MKTPDFRSSPCAPAVALRLLLPTLAFSLLLPSQASQVPNPTVTASAKPYSSGYVAANLFAPGRAEYATAGLGACSAPLTLNTNDGTWVELDFGANVSFDRFILATRPNNADVVGTNRLYVGSSSTHSLGDSVGTWSTAGQNGSGPIHDLGAAVSGRYARWEVLSLAGSSRNTGGRHMWFLSRPANMNSLPGPTVINASTPYNATYDAAHLTDGKCGTDACAEEFAVNGTVTPGSFFVDMDFGGSTLISGFDFLPRDVDLFPTLTLIFSDDSTFSTAIATNSWTNSLTSGNLWTSGTFAPINARYVRLVGSGYASGNPGGREILFYTPAGQAPHINQQPQAGTRYLYDLVTLSVVALGDPPLAYQWRQDGNLLAGATTSALTLNPLQFANGGTYTVVVTNAFGSITSTPTLLVVSNPPVNLTAGLTAYYAFDETNGTVAADSSGNNYSATLFNFPSDDSMWVPGRIGGGLVFNVLDSATNNYVLTDTPLNFTDPDLFTFVFWAKRLSDNNPYNPRFIVPVGNQHWVLWTPNAGVGFYPPAKSPEPIREIWTHFVVTYDRPNGKYELYVNGAKAMVAQASGYVRPAPDSSSQQWVIGHSEVLNRDLDPWRGFLDDVRIYNRILYPGEAKALYDLAGQLPPSFSQQPQSTTVYVGETLRLTAIVDGTPPIAVQWQKNGTNIPGAVSSTLTIPNAQAGDAGNYVLVASNIVKTVSSAAAHVTLTPVTSVINGLAGYWKFDEASGSTAADASGSGHNGTVRNDFGDGGQWVAGKVGRALQFRGPASAGGAADYVVVPGWPKAINGTMTLSAWVWADALSDQGRIVCGGSGVDGVGQFLLTLNAGSSDLRGYIQDATRSQTSAQEGIRFPTNSWQHVVLVADGSALRLYRNGVQVASLFYSGTLFNTTNLLSIGARLTADDSAAESGWWQGKIDDVAYWTRGLRPSEVFELYAAGSAGQPVTQADAFSNALPVLITAPQPASVFLHEALTLQVTATGVLPLQYQWRLDGLPIAGATDNVYAKASAESADAGSYTVVVSAGNGGSVTSTPVAVSVSSPVPTPDTGLVLYLKFDEASGSTAADNTPSASNGNLINFLNPDTNWVPGLFGGALLFAQGAPTADVVSVPDQPFLNFDTNAFSISFWAKGPALQTASGGLLCKGVGGGGEAYCLDIWSGAYRFFVRDTARQVGSMLQTSVSPSGKWQHVAIIYNPAQGQSGIYIDGTLAVAAATVEAVALNTDPLDIGARQYQGGYTLPWTGALDDLRIYGRAITPLEVRALTYQGLPPRLRATYAAGKLTLDWPFEAIGYELQSAPGLTGGSWTLVPGVASNSFTLTPSNAGTFYRLHRK